MIVSETSLKTAAPAMAVCAASPAEGVRSEVEFHPHRSFFLDLPGPFGPHDLSVRAAGISTLLEGLSSRQRAELAARYGIFARAAEDAAPDLRVRLSRSPRPSFLRVQSGAGPEMYRLLTRREGSDLLAWSYEWASSTRLDEGEGVLVVTSNERVVFDRAVENYLRVAFAHLALEKGGFLLHGAAVVRGGRAFVFFGPSGSGKTTVTALSKGARVLSDDLVMIVREGSGFAAASVPFRGLLAPPASSSQSYELAGLFRLVKDSEHYLEELSRPRAAGEVVQSLPFVTERPEEAPRILEIVSDALQSVRVSRLHFRKDAEFWRVLENV